MILLKECIKARLYTKMHTSFFLIVLIFHRKESDGDVGCGRQTWSGHPSEQTTSA